jgi:NADPH-ferrihemoprotein reductase
VNYGVFGLGNKQYEHFNAVGKRMHKSLEALGATPVVRRGDGDDDDCIDDDFEKWCTDLFEALEAAPEVLGAAAGEGAAGAVSLASYRVELHHSRELMLYIYAGAGSSSSSSQRQMTRRHCHCRCCCWWW